jgi:hypothetical protein
MRGEPESDRGGSRIEFPGMPGSGIERINDRLCVTHQYPLMRDASIDVDVKRINLRPCVEALAWLMAGH